ncbi:MAG TPA: response regulator [Alphaproteobacteria bacterium]|nr:response regulator [Alphaproteobacteria bacterium]USO06621.1 MAG: response regulator [Rhodospirillales bacterium]HOO80954.1 response regulator [Alphaproteobacteria bacterium]
MSLDHSEFIRRHHKTAQTQSPPGPVRRRHDGLFAVILFTIFAVFLGYILTLAPLSQDMKIITSMALALCCLVGFILYRGYHNHRQLDEELELVREVMEGSRGARLIIDSADNTLYYNQKFERLCRGVGPPSFSSLLRLFDYSDEVAAHFRLLTDQAHRGLTDSIELFSRYEDQERWLLITAQPIAGRAGYVHWRIDDVTEKHTADTAIRAEREKLIDFTDNAPVGFFSVDEKGRFVFANATFARWLGEDLQILLESGRLHTYMLNPPEDANPYDLIKEGTARQITEVQMKGTAGKTFLASINQVIVREGAGPDGKQRVRTRAVVHDLTTESEMRQALKASEDRFQRFFDEAPVGIILIDEEGKVADCNAAFAGIIETPIDKIEGQTFNDLIDEEDRDEVTGALGRIEKGQRLDAPLEISLKGATGPVETQMHAKKFKLDGRTVLHFIDLTEKKALEVQFVQSQKMQAIGQLAGGVAHDFNNLLTAIIGFCDLLLLRHKPGDPSFGDIMQIKQNSNRAANLVRQLLAFSRQQTLRPRIHDVSDILYELSHLIRRLIGTNIELELIHGEALGPVKVDEGQMEQVLINLAVNARDAMDEHAREGATLTIETQNFTNRKTKKLISEELPPGHWVTIKVSDTGCGIEKKNLSRIFEPFFTTKQVGEGTGLGLATVYGIIRQTGGFLDVESKVATKDKEGGTSFIIYLPRISKDEAEAEEEHPETEEVEAKDLTGTERILLVEDEDAVRTFSERALTNKGYEVLTADSGESALNLMEKQENQKIDLLVTDVVMPNMDGPTLAQRMRQTSPGLKIIFMSGYTEDKLKDHMGENIFFLPKPFTLKQLAAKVKDVLGD